MTFFINGLSLETQSVVARYREKTPRRLLRYEELVQFALDEGQACRTRREVSSQQPQPQRKPTSAIRHPDKHAVHFVDDDEVIAEGATPQDQLLFLNGSLPPSIATNELPSTDESSYQDIPENEQLLYTQVTRPPALRYNDRRNNLNRPGWISRPNIVCYQCYVVNKHVSRTVIYRWTNSITS